MPWDVVFGGHLQVTIPKENLLLSTFLRKPTTYLFTGTTHARNGFFEKRSHCAVDIAALYSAVPVIVL